MTPLADLASDLAVLQDAATIAGAESEVTLQTSESRTIGWAEGRPNLNTAAVSRGACLRVLSNGGQGIATTTVPDPEIIRGLSRRALEAARSSGADPHRRLAPPAAHIPSSVPGDANILRRGVDEILAELRELEAAALASDKRLKKVVRLNFSETRFENGVANSRGLCVTGNGTASSVSLELLAEDGESTEAAWDYQAHRQRSRLKMAEVVFETAADALRSLGGKPIATGKYSVVFHPRVGAHLLDLVGGALSAEAVQLGRSFLAGFLGKRAASTVVTLVDDPFLPDGLASSAFDDEGIPHQRLEPIVGGMLTSYFYDLRSAAREGCESNGHASKETLGSAPHPGPTNLFIQPGATTANEMLAADASVFLLKDVMGLHMADPITGEFSLGASGYLYEKGVFIRPVRGVTIAGSLGGVLQSVEAVGNDLRFYGSVGSPSLLVRGLTIAGH